MYTDKRITGDVRTFEELVAKVRGWLEHDFRLGEDRESQLSFALGIVEDVAGETGCNHCDDTNRMGFCPKDLEYAVRDLVDAIHGKAAA